MRNKTRIRSRRRAGALAYALVMTVCLGVCVASVLSLTGQEHKLTMRRIVLREASNALESTLNYGVSQIVYRTGVASGIAPDFLKTKPLRTPLLKKVQTKDSKRFSIFNEFGSGGFADIDPSDVEILGGYALVSPTPVKISTGNPSSVTDPDKGKTVFVKTVPLLASVRVPVSGGRDITVYAKASLSIREVPLAAYAVFYNNMPLEISPGASMNINGPVHCNKDIILGGSGSVLSVAGTLTSAGTLTLAGTSGGSMGDVYVAYKDANNNGNFDTRLGWTYDATRAENEQSPFFDSNKKGSGELIKMSAVVLKDAEGNKIDTYVDSTLEKRLAKLDSMYGGWKDFATTLSNGNMQDSSQGVTPVTPAGMNMNDGRTVIEPPITNPSAPGYDAEKENVKYGNKAGLYIYVETDGTVTAFQDAKSAGDYKASNNKTAWKNAHSNRVLALPADVVKSGKDAGSFLDRRENKAVTTVDLDMGKMREYIAGKSPSGAPHFEDKGETHYSLDTPDSKGWNGIVYVDVQNPDTGWTTFDPKDSDGNSLTAPTVSTLTAVRVVNAATDPSNDLAGVPDRSHFDPAGARGFTLATNAPMYTKGSVNADGNSDTGSSTNPDSKSVTALGSECAMNLVADAITTLSGNFDESRSYLNDKSSRPAFTEISAALTVGQVYDAATNTASGGYNNFPRLLEQWTDTDVGVSSRVTLSIRGSMAALFKSQYAVGLCNLSYYRPPARDWGYSAIFGSGYYPPGTPVMRSYRRTNFRYLTAEEYKAEKESFWTKDGATVAKGGDFAKFPW